jgi:tetratricopeptide (TPR) repeat protein
LEGSVLADHEGVAVVLTQAVARYRDGDMVAAAELFHSVLTLDPSNAIASHQLGLIAFAAGDVASAAAHLKRAAADDPADAEYQNNLGVVLSTLGDHAGAQAAFEAALKQNAGFAQAANNLGAALEAQGQDGAAIGAYARALAIDPAYVEARDNLLLVTSRVTPPWHFPMMADGARNDAYDRALRRLAPGKRVLDIGTGAGLLAMMAARAGAASVTTCEMSAPIAAAAREIIAANRLSDRITLHAKRSDQIEIGRDMQERAEVLVTETFASGLVSESVLPTIEHARQHLLSADAVIIPHRAAAIGYLVGGPVIEAQLYASSGAGFDLSPFDLFAPVKLGLHLDRVPHQVLSDDFEIFAFDLTRDHFPPERRPLGVTATAAGRCVGVAQWLRLELDARTTYENRPHAESGANGWMHVVYRFQRPVDVEAGQTVRLVCGHNRTSMTVAVAPGG